METPTNRPCRKSRIPRYSGLPSVRDFTKDATQTNFANSIVPEVPSPKLKPGAVTDSGIPGVDGTFSSGPNQRDPIDESPRNGIEDIGSFSHTLPSRRRPRPSLSDRTAETLAQIPLSASPKRRRSSFFQSNNPMSSPMRPASSMARARPNTSMGLRPPLPDLSSTSKPFSPAKARLAPTTGNRLPPKTPMKKDISTLIPRSLPPSRPGIMKTHHLTPTKQRSSMARIRANNHEPTAR